MSAPRFLEVPVHLKPVKFGGTDDLGNLVSSCGDCNLGKGDRWTTAD